MLTTRLLGALGLLALLSASPLAYAGLGEGADLEIGGPGPGKGKFRVIADITFDAQDNLYVLDGADKGKSGAMLGNMVVQKFDNAGKFLAQFPLSDIALADRNQPARLAVDARGHIFVTFPDAGLVREYGPDGAVERNFRIPRAFAIAVRKIEGKEQVVVVARPAKEDEPVAAMQTLTPGATQAGAPIALSQAIADCVDIDTDAQGNLYAAAAVDRLYKFDPAGRLLAAIGGGTRLRLEDGSELVHTVAVDSRGHIFSITPGNPGKVTKFDPALQTATQHPGQHSWCDPYGPASSYTPFAIDSRGRLWIATVGANDGTGQLHFRPCVLRTKADFLDPETNQATVASTLLLGLNLAVETPLPYNVTCRPGAIPADFVVRPGARRVKAVSVTWNAYDVVKNEVGKGKFELPLVDGREARQTVAFTPPRLGWYMLEFQVFSGTERLTGIAGFFGVTTRYPNMPALAEKESAGGWEDPPRQAFAGLMCMRVHPKADNMEQVDKVVQQAAKYGCTVVAQFEGKDQCAPDHVRWVVTKFKGRLKHYEIINEPNFSMKPVEYAHLLRQVYPLIKEIDPNAQVLAPAVCGIQLPWYEAFFRSPGNKCFDVLSVHDYEGHESIDPVHWKWKFGELRTLMALQDNEAKPIWQTERAITGIRGKTFIGPSQAVRVTLHLDVLASLGVPAEHNLHYYLNEGGYGDCPSFLWSKAGPHPGALATRTRFAMVQGRTCTGTLDFGATGNKFLLGLAYKGDDGTTLILRNLGTQDLPVEMAVKGAPASVECVDAFGNSQALPAIGGKVWVTTSNLPVYLRLPKTQEAAPVPIDFGPNMAAEARFAYSASTTSSPVSLTNNIMEVFHAGHPHGGTDKPPIWTGDFPKSPQTLEITFPQPRQIGGVCLYGVRPDNQFCALLDYDLECHDGKAWVTLQKVRGHCPPTDLVETPLCVAAGWYLDPNCFVQQFAPVTTDRLRVVVQRTTIGFLPDETARKAWGSKMEPHLMLREIEIYGPAAAPKPAPQPPAPAKPTPPVPPKTPPATPAKTPATPPAPPKTPPTPPPAKPKG